MAVRKHMTNGDLLRIRKFMAQGIVDVGVIQQTVLVHASRIQQVIDVGLEGPAKAQAEATAADKAALLQAKAERAKEAAEKAAKESDDLVVPAPKKKAAAPKKQTAAEKAKAKAAAAVDPLS